MTDHPKVKGYSLTQLGSMANVVGLRTGSTAGHNLCHDLTSSVRAMMAFSNQIIGVGDLSNQQLLSSHTGQNQI